MPWHCIQFFKVCFMPTSLASYSWSTHCYLSNWLFRQNQYWFSISFSTVHHFFSNKFLSVLCWYYSFLWNFPEALGFQSYTYANVSIKLLLKFCFIRFLCYDLLVNTLLEVLATVLNRIKTENNTTHKSVIM